MRSHESSSVFNYSWLQTAKAFFVRYPNPYSAHVLTEDTLWRRVDAEGRLVTLKLLRKTNKAPAWTKRYINFSETVVVERSVMDLRGRTLETRTVNVDGSRKFLSVKEVVTYAAAEDPGQTVARRQAWFECPYSYGLGYLIRKMSSERYAHNIAKTDAGFKHVLMRLFPRPGDAPPVPAKTKLLDKAQKATQKLKETSEKKQEVCKV